MRILVATDSFKDALPAPQVAEAIARGLLDANPALQVRPFPLADGGEGTVDILVRHSGGSWQESTVQNPLGRPVVARWGLSGDGQTAFLEMAQASGIQLLRFEDRNCMHTSTFGTGELVREAVERGAKRVLLGIGSSATNDAGMGMASALGYRFLDPLGKELEPLGRNLIHVDRIDDSEALPGLSEVEFTVLSDVNNPLYGPTGAAYSYARQKGASPEEIIQLDAGLQQFAGVLERYTGSDQASFPGAGAAGGMGAGTRSFLKATLRPGIDAVMELCRFDEALNGVDWIITGEGKIDAQTLNGKLILGVTKRAQARKIPVIGLCGTLGVAPDQLRSMGLEAAFSLIKKPATLAESIADTAQNLRELAFNVGRLLRPSK
jgi:glycerate kinase